MSQIFRSREGLSLHVEPLADRPGPRAVESQKALGNAGGLGVFKGCEAKACASSFLGIRGG